jgi:cytidine deaminase
VAETPASGGVSRRAVLGTLLSVGAGSVALAPALRAFADEGGPLASVLPKFALASRRKLHEVLRGPGFSGQIPAESVKELMASEQKPVAALMVGLLPLARTFSHPPISNYRVGIVARGASNALYLGFNIEIPGQALGFAVHGEQTALSSAYMHGEPGVSAVALTAAPCGHCRQFMTELSPDVDIDILVDGAAPMKLSALLPMSFGPKDLGRKEGALPVRETKLRSASANSDPAVQAAIEAAGKSYAPYSRSPSGVAILSKSGRVYPGSYIENVAFNPSLSPLQTALVQMILAGEQYAAIARVVLTEQSGAKISQRLATEAVASAVAPGVQVEVVSVWAA